MCEKLFGKKFQDPEMAVKCECGQIYDLYLFEKDGHILGRVPKIGDQFLINKNILDVMIK